jgi:glutamate/tyrosine decarboxylase-like PLP-dependent enzyme
MTSGGTESLILVCKAYRDFALQTRGVTKPNIVMPVRGKYNIVGE